jgi:hypothetical protein
VSHGDNHRQPNRHVPEFRTKAEKMMFQCRNACKSLTRIVTIHLYYCVLQFRKVRETLYTSCWSFFWYYPLIFVPINIECHGIERVNAISILFCVKRKWWLKILSLGKLLYVSNELLDLRLGNFENPETSNRM